VEALTLSEGWGVMHLYYRVNRVAAEGDADAGKRVAAAIDALESDGHQALVSVVLGHKADLGVMVLGPDLARLHTFQQELRAVAALEPVASYVSMTELSEYTSTEDDERARLEAEGVTGAQFDAQLDAWRARMADYAEHRLHPVLPSKRFMCFYPMSKRRDRDANWYALPFDERRRLMGGHARVGRTYAGRVLQLITGSVGLDDFEWGVTLFADDAVAIKEIVYEMRFDEVSATYADFGWFISGLLLEPADALGRVGLPVS
jgi:chlorite dismutase